MKPLCHIRLCHGTPSVSGACCAPGSTQCPWPVGPGGSLCWAALQCRGLCLFRTHKLRDKRGQTALPHSLNPTVCLPTARLISPSILVQVCCFPQQHFAGTWISLSLQRGWGSWQLLRFVCMPLSPLTQLPARNTHTFLAATARTRGVLLGRHLPSASLCFRFCSSGSPCTQLSSARQLPARRAAHGNTRLRDQQPGLRNVPRFAKIA